MVFPLSSGSPAPPSSTVLKTGTPSTFWPALPGVTPATIRVLPAIAEAVFHATGFRCKDLPITPEKILKGTGKL